MALIGPTPQGSVLLEQNRRRPYFAPILACLSLFEASLTLESIYSMRRKREKTRKSGQSEMPNGEERIVPERASYPGRKWPVPGALR